MNRSRAGRRRRWILWGWTVLVLVTACGQQEQVLTAAAIPAGWQPVQQKGLALALPPGWQVITAEQTDTGGSLDALGTANPQLRPLLDRARQLLSGGQVQLMAFDLDPAQSAPGFTTNLTMGSVPAQGATFKQVRATNATQLRSTGTFADVTDSDRVVAGLPAAEFVYTMKLADSTGTATPLRVDQYLWLANDIQYVATFTTTPDQATAMTPIFRQLVATIRPAK